MPSLYSSKVKRSYGGILDKGGQMTVTTKRIYEPYAKKDGLRIFVDRLWARGLSKEDAHVDIWLKDIAPSDGLRKWFGHDPEKWQEFKKRYKAELKTNEALIELKKYARKQNITLLYGAKDERHNQAVVLKELL
ncbi:protein of unknown function DUF488 [candidate division TM7 genomosp. GTL1]|nr:protein of unknown function DUF488 [candidate division TM7 genomosp. GTL1]